MQTVQVLELLISNHISVDLHLRVNLFKHFRVCVLVIQNTYNILFVRII